ncbi:unnamed protein product, partial [Cladocopium goreaui]
QVWLGGCGNTATDPAHVAKVVPKKKGLTVAGTLFKACPGNYQCVMLSKAVFKNPGDKVRVKVTLITSLKKFDYYVGIIGHRGIGTWSDEVHFCLSGGRGEFCFVSQKYKDADFGSQGSSGMPALDVGDEVIMSLTIGEEEERPRIQPGSRPATHPVILKTFANLRQKASASGPWEGWRLFIGLTGATCAVEMLT